MTGPHPLTPPARDRTPSETPDLPRAPWCEIAENALAGLVARNQPFEALRDRMARP